MQGLFSRTMTHGYTCRDETKIRIRAGESNDTMRGGQEYGQAFIRKRRTKGLKFTPPSGCIP